MQASFACVLGLVTCQGHMHRWVIDGRVVSTSGSESVGSIPGGRPTSKFFYPFYLFFLLEVTVFWGFFLFILK